MPKKLMTNQAKAQAIYMDELIQIAIQNALKNKSNLAFDPQGRVLIDVNPTAEQTKEIVKKINKQLNKAFAEDAEGLSKALGRKLTSTTIVSLDIEAIKPLHSLYNEQLKNALDKYAPNLSSKIIGELDKSPKGSLIALQQEFHFHLALTSRVYQKIIPNGTSPLVESQLKKAQEGALKDLNKVIIDTYAQALVAATNNDGIINFAQLNKSLDKARKDLMPQAHSLLMQHIIKNTGVVLTAKDFEKKVEGKSLRVHAEALTATPNDVLHTDARENTVMWIAGSENTAHLRIKGEEFAHRQIITPSLSAKSMSHRIQIRTPSPVLKVGLENDHAYISDVRDKLKKITSEYDLKNRLTSDKNKPCAFIYNSYTAINDRLGDINGNLQTQSAQHILRGAHRYNVGQLRTGTPPVFCFVQNISVNGFGDALGYETDNELVKESTLMTEMALLHTLYTNSLPEEQKKIGEVFTLYKEFLDRSPHRESYFSKSREGLKAQAAIQNLKMAWKTPSPPQEDMATNAKLGLKKLMAHNLHFGHEYAKTIQALSVFIEDASIGGCKSGNERAQAINGRVAVLDSLIGKSKKQSAIVNFLSQLAEGKNSRSTAKEFKNALDSEYNKRGLQSGASIISLVDQGASAKVEAKPKRFSLFSYFKSRNYAEEQSSVMTNLHQSKSGAMQAHKGLTTQMKQAWSGNPKSWWSRMTSNPLGVVGAVLSFILILPPIIVAIYSAVDNAQRKKATTELNKKIQIEGNDINKSLRKETEQVIKVKKSERNDQEIAEDVKDFKEMEDSTKNINRKFAQTINYKLLHTSREEKIKRIFFIIDTESGNQQTEKIKAQKEFFLQASDEEVNQAYVATLKNPHHRINARDTKDEIKLRWDALTQDQQIILKQIETQLLNSNFKEAAKFLKQLPYDVRMNLGQYFEAHSKPIDKLREAMLNKEFREARSASLPKSFMPSGEIVQEQEETERNHFSNLSH